MFAQQPAVADNRGGDASQSQDVPQGCLSRSDDRSAGSRFQFLDDRVRAKIKASNDDAVARRIPGAEREVQDFLGRRLGETKAVADAHAGVGDRFDAACGKEWSAPRRQPPRHRARSRSPAASRARCRRRRCSWWRWCRGSRRSRGSRRADARQIRALARCSMRCSRRRWRAADSSRAGGSSGRRPSGPSR